MSRANHAAVKMPETAHREAASPKRKDSTHRETQDEVYLKLSQERLKREAAKARREEIALAKDAGELIPVEHYEATIARLVKLFVGAMETLPDILERDHGADKAILDGVRTALDRARRELHDEATKK